MSSVELEEQDRRPRQQLGLLALIARAVTAPGTSIEALLDPCTHAIATVLAAESMGVWTRAPDSVQLRLRSTRSTDGAPQAMADVALGAPHAAALASAAHSAVFTNPRFEEPLFAPVLSGPERYCSAVPLVIDGDRLVGVLALIRTARLSPAEEEVFASTAEYLALAIEKQRTTERLREREDGLGTLIRTAPDGMVLMDADSHILATNPSLDRIFGYDEGELVGREIMVLMPERLRGRHIAGVRRYQQTGEKHTSWHGIELQGLRKDGTEIHIEISFGEYVHDDRRVFTGFIRDITGRKRTEAIERRRRRVIQTAAVYLGATLVALEAADLLLPVLPVPAWSFRVLVLLAVIGLPVACAIAWGFETVAHGVRRPRRGGTPAGHSHTPHTPETSHSGPHGLQHGHHGHHGHQHGHSHGHAHALPNTPHAAPHGNPHAARTGHPHSPSTGQRHSRAQSAHGLVPRGPVLLGAALLIGATAVGALLLAAARPLEPAAQPTFVAVLPFRGGDDAATVELARALTDDVANQLMDGTRVRVLSRTSVETTAAAGGTVAELARALRADYVVEGSVRTVGSHVRVSVQLVRAGRDDQVWAAAYRDELDRISEMPPALAASVAAGVHAALSRSP